MFEKEFQQLMTAFNGLIYEQKMTNYHLAKIHQLLLSVQKNSGSPADSTKIDKS